MFQAPNDHRDSTQVIEPQMGVSELNFRKSTNRTTYANKNSRAGNSIGFIYTISKIKSVPKVACWRSQAKKKKQRKKNRTGSLAIEKLGLNQERGKE